MYGETIDFECLTEGCSCPVDGCDGHMEAGTPEGCSCHISAPCSACENSGLVCDACGLDTAEDWKEKRESEREQEAKLRTEKRGKRRHQTTHTQTANPYNSTPFTACCGIAAIRTDRCPNCEALITHHDDGLAARRKEVGFGNCLMCGKPRSKALQPGGCCC